MVSIEINYTHLYFESTFYWKHHRNAIWKNLSFYICSEQREQKTKLHFREKSEKKFAALLSRRVSHNEPEANRHQYPEKAANFCQQLLATLQDPFVGPTTYLLTFSLVWYKLGNKNISGRHLIRHISSPKTTQQVETTFRVIVIIFHCRVISKTNYFRATEEGWG